MRSLPQLLGDREAGQLPPRLLHCRPSLVSRLRVSRCLEAHEGCVNCMTWSDDGQQLATSSDDCRVVLWSFPTWRAHACFHTGHAGNVFCVRFLPQAPNLVATCAADGTMRVCDVVAGASWTYGGHRGIVHKLVVVPSEPHVVLTASSDGSSRLYDTRSNGGGSSSRRTGQVVVPPASKASCAKALHTIALEPLHQRLFAVGGSDGYARIYDRRMLPVRHHALGTVRSFMPEQLMGSRSHHAVCSVAFSHDGSELAASFTAENIYTFDVASARQNARLMTASSSKAASYAAGAAVQQDAGAWAPALGAGDEAAESREAPPSQLCLSGPPLGSSSSARQGAGSSGQQYTSRSNGALPRVAADDPLSRRVAACCAAFDRTSAVALSAPPPAKLALSEWRGYWSAAADRQERRQQLDEQYTASARLTASLMTDLLDSLDDLESAQPQLQETSSAVAEEINGPPSTGPSRLHPPSPPPPAPPPPAVAVHRSWSLPRAAWERRQQQAASSTGASSGSSGGNGCSNAGAASAPYAHKAVFKGHRNIRTIKDVAYMGHRSEYILSGSDDARLFVWCRSSGEVLLMQDSGDRRAVNCMEPHPSTCVLATGGIDSTVKVWEPVAEEPDDLAELADVAARNADMLANPYSRLVPMEVMRALLRSRARVR